MKRIISVICILAMLTAFCPVFAAEETVENFTDNLVGTKETFLTEGSEGYIPQRFAKAANSLDFEDYKGNMGNVIHRAGGWYNESAYITYRVRPGSKVVVCAYDNVDDYDISFRYSKSGAGGDYIAAKKKSLEDYKSPQRDNPNQYNVFAAFEYTLNMPQGANFLTIYLPDAATEDAPTTPLYSNWSIGIVSVSMQDADTVNEELPTVNINWNDVHQLIEGFGGALQQDGTHQIQRYPELLNFLYDPVDGLGFSIVRTVVPTEPRTDGEGPLKEEGKECDFTADGAQVWAMQEIKKLNPDVTVMACSWTPMLYMKDNKQLSGGKLLPEYYQEYAEFFADYIEGYEREHGVKIDIISPQNEPESAPGWGSCIWTGEDFHKFLKENLIPEFEKRGIDTEIMIGDFANFRFPKENFPYLDDEETRDKVDLISGHSYWGICDRFPYGKELGKRIWQTETSDTNTPDNPTMEYGISWAEQVHVLLTRPEVNAFLYWYLAHAYGNCEALITTKNDGYVINKRCWVFGNYSKFIRPGYYRIGADESPIADAFISAYKDEKSGKCVAVCINDSTEEMTFNYKLNGFTAESVTGYRTSGDENLVPLTPKNVTGDTVELTLTPRSVTSFVFDGCASEIASGTIEAETGTQKLGNAQNAANNNFSGKLGVKNISAKDNGVVFGHTAAASSASVRYASLGATGVQYDLYVNDNFVRTIDFPSTLTAGKAAGDVYFEADIPENSSVKLVSKVNSDGIFIDSLTLNPSQSNLSLIPIAAQAKDFSWAEYYITAVADSGVMDISTEDAGSVITRGEFVKVLINLLNLKSEWDMNFFDVYDTTDYNNQVGIAKALGVVPSNDENMFFPNDFITREDMLIFTANALKQRGYVNKGGVDTSVFSDWDSLSEDGKEAALLLISNGIISGNGGSIDPHGYTYYAAAAVVINALM